ncbi:MULTISPECIES: RNA polymerase sigma factor SigJ [unclassified Microbacterium]|uniref:RNA polymerase sigma factor SigJ n=1 Tax=unclassified Microbacterium TaxID=2609290 RepID=UPI000EA97247|nr:MULTISPECIES: RNA polymerase sigma factor SigJ [unclassified Microbacterium]MBT2483488.1 RNA polymerase sigma factor SigJ [Microbacterium sp. ISL-108]RKN66506.1 sigma-70 family RNA polymerase sigma factor [Microbacterium sp. CGR2]
MATLDVAAPHLRGLMFSIAYRMLGSVVEAEDVVQNAFLRMHQRSSESGPIDNMDAYVTTVTSRLAIDALRSARRVREVYVGPWLPEPLLVDDDDPSHRLEHDEALSVGVLTLLERLGPTERAVFVLRSAFDLDYTEIAEIVGKTDASCRQLMRRARQRLDGGKPRFDATQDERDRVMAAFATALRSGDVNAVVATLAPDVVALGDGGGRAPAIRKPITGAVNVARFLLGLARVADARGVTLEPVVVNGEHGLIARDAEGRVLSVLTVHVEPGAITMLTNQLNPDKLGHLGEVGDMYALLGA